jgi:hypothetical protein
MRIWLRRDDKNQLWLYTKEPIFDHNINTYFPAQNSNMSRVNSHLFEEEIPLGSRPIEFNIDRVVIQKTNEVDRFS